MQLPEAQQLFPKYLCEVHPSLLSLVLQGLAPKSGSKPESVEQCIVPALRPGKAGRPLKRNAEAEV